MPTARSLRALGLAWLACGCAQLPPRAPRTGPVDQRFQRPLRWERGQPLLQGLIGVAYLSDFQVSPDGSPPVELEDDETEILPVFAGGAQWKLGGERTDFGLEAYASFSGRSDLEAFASSGGTAVAVFDVDLLMLELYGGPFVSRFLENGVRLYGAAGPLLQWVGYDQSDGTDEESADGSGGGWYARTGLEFPLPGPKLVGFGVRWSESSLDLDPGFGDLDVSGLQLYVSYSYGLEPRRAFDDR
jgi:hypothetical protein